MAQRGRTSRFSFTDFSGGLNTRYANTEIGDNQSPDLLNVRFDNKGEIRKRFGFEKTTTAGIGSGTAALDQFLYVKNDGTQLQLVSSDTDMYERTSPAGLTWASIKTGLTAGARFDYVEVDDLLYCGNGVDATFKYDGTTDTDVATIPEGNIMIYWQGKLWVAGSPTEPSNLYFSKTNAVLGDIEDFTVPSGGGILFIGKDDGQKITALKALGDSLIVFKERSTYRVFFNDGLAIYQEKLLDPIFGCVGKNACTNVQNDIMFFTGEEVRRLGFDAQYFDQIRTNPISDEIGNEFEDLEDKENTYMAFFDKKLYVAISKETATVDTVFMLDTRYKGWAKWDGLDVNGFLADNLNEVLYFSSHSTDRIYQFNEEFSDDGTAISARWQSKNFDVGRPDAYKRFRWLFITSRNSTGELCWQAHTTDNKAVTISDVRCMNIGQFTGLADWNLIDWNVTDWNVTPSSATDTELVYNRLSLGDGGVPKGLAVSFIFTNDNLDEDLSLQSFVLEYSMKDKRHYPSSHTR